MDAPPRRGGGLLAAALLLAVARAQSELTGGGFRVFACLQAPRAPGFVARMRGDSCGRCRYRCHAWVAAAAGGTMAGVSVRRCSRRVRVTCAPSGLVCGRRLAPARRRLSRVKRVVPCAARCAWRARRDRCDDL